jgi:two-component system cell cycle sensor histidine kinase/response regulator CckA
MNANLEELAQTLFEEAGDALFLFDTADGRLVEVNPMAQRLCGLSRPALLEESVGTLFRSEVQGGADRLRQAYQVTGAFHAQDGFFLRRSKDDGWLPVNLTLARLHARSKTLGLITARDVSEQRRSAAALREGEARQRAILVALVISHATNSGQWVCWRQPLTLVPEMTPCVDADLAP